MAFSWCRFDLRWNWKTEGVPKDMEGTVYIKSSRDNDLAMDSTKAAMIRPRHHWSETEMLYNFVDIWRCKKTTHWFFLRMPCTLPRVRPMLLVRISQMKREPPGPRTSSRPCFASSLTTPCFSTSLMRSTGMLLLLARSTACWSFLFINGSAEPPSARTLLVYNWLTPQWEQSIS